MLFAEVVFENFGELIIQAILLFRFQWLVNKDDFSTLGFSFQVYVTSVMGLSFFTMLSALTKYHKRGCRSRRTLFFRLFWCQFSQRSAFSG